MPLSEESWDEILTALQFRGDEAGLRGDQTVERLALMRVFWEEFKDKASVQAYIKEKQLQALRTQREEAIASVAHIENTIREVENATAIEPIGSREIE